MKTTKFTKLFLITLISILSSISTFSQNQHLRPGKHEFIVYDDPGYKGAHKKFKYNKNNSAFNFSNHRWDERIGSIKVGKGLKLSLYDNPAWDTKGSDTYLVLFEGDSYGLERYNNSISSVKMEIIEDNTPLIKLEYQSNHFQTLGPGSYKNNQLIEKDKILKVTVPKHLNATLYDGYDFNDTSFEIKTNNLKNKTLNLHNFEFANKTASIKVMRRDYAIIATRYFDNPKVLKSNQEKHANDYEINNMGNPDEVQGETNIDHTSTTSTTTDWSNSTSLGISVTTTIGTNEAAPVQASVAVTTSLENTFSFGKSRSEEKSTIQGSKLVITAPGNTIKKSLLMVTRQKLKYKVEFTYAPILKVETIDGVKKVTYNQDKKTWVKQIESVIIDKATKVAGKVIDVTLKGSSTNNTSNTPIIIGSTGLQLAEVRGALYTVVKDGTIFKYNGTPNSWSKIGSTGIGLAAANGALYTVVKDGTIFKYNGTPNSWSKIGSSGIGLTASNGNLYAIVKDGAIFKYNGTPNSWSKIGSGSKNNWKNKIPHIKNEASNYFLKPNGEIYQKK